MLSALILQARGDTRRSVTVKRRERIFGQVEYGIREQRKRALLN